LVGDHPLSHASTEDDWYGDMYIPKGMVCLPNMRLLNCNLDVFGGDAAQFDPGRYLDEKGKATTPMEGREEGHLSFGFGRRICVGRHVAEDSLAIDFATLLWAMRFERPEGAQGELGTHTLFYTG
jgi:cytochrome P450